MNKARQNVGDHMKHPLLLFLLVDPKDIPTALPVLKFSGNRL